MYRTKTCKAFVGLGVISMTVYSWLGVSLSAVANTPVQTTQFKPHVSGKGRPGGLSPGGSRGECEDASVPKSLSPLGDRTRTSIIPVTTGKTTAKYPSVLVYVPPMKAKQGRFSLKNEKNQVVYQTALDLTNKSGVTSIRLSPQTFAGLEVGKRYRWVFSVICPNSPDRGSDPYVEAEIFRTELSPSFSNQLTQASATERILLYENAGFWYDALVAAAELRRSSPADIAVKTTWTNLLKATGLKQIATEPLF